MVDPRFDWGITRVMPKQFRRQIEFALERGFTFQTISEYLSHKNDHSKRIAITFDDGYKSVFTKAFPFLKENNIPATVFLTTGAIDNNDLIWTDKLNLLKNIDRSAKLTINNKTYTADQLKKTKTLEEIKSYFKSLPNADKDEEINTLLSQSSTNCNSIAQDDKMLSWEDIASMDKEEIEFGTHTVTHPILTKIEKSEAEKEIVDSKKRIESMLKKPVTTFCYPNGQAQDFDENIINIVKNNGFRCAVTTIEGKVESSKNIYALRRITLANRRNGLVILKIIKELLKNA